MNTEPAAVHPKEQSLVAGLLRKKKSREAWVNREALQKVVQGRVLFQEPLARYTTLRVGGPAEALVFPKSLEDFRAVLAFAEPQKIPVFMLGGGSNLLIRDGGIRGLVVCLREGAVEVQEIARPEEAPDDTTDDHLFFRLQAGASLPKIVRQFVQQGYAGLEGLAGVVGSVGGAVVGNSGTRHGTMGDVLVSLTAVNRAGQTRRYLKKDLTFAYRSLDLDRSWHVVEAEIRLKKSDPVALQATMKTYMDYRQKTQPLNFPNVGSIFKNPRNEVAGELIERHGLKGVRLRGAKISELHGNWIVNVGEAKAQDILQLIEMVQDKIKEAEDIEMETEIKIVGERQ